MSFILSLLLTSVKEKVTRPKKITNKKKNFDKFDYLKIQ